MAVLATDMIIHTFHQHKVGLIYLKELPLMGLLHTVFFYGRPFEKESPPSTPQSAPFTLLALVQSRIPGAIGYFQGKRHPHLSTSQGKRAKRANASSSSCLQIHLAAPSSFCTILVLSIRHVSIELIYLESITSTIP